MSCGGAVGRERGRQVVRCGVRARSCCSRPLACLCSACCWMCGTCCWPVVWCSQVPSLACACACACAAGEGCGAPKSTVLHAAPRACACSAAIRTLRPLPACLPCLSARNTDPCPTLVHPAQVQQDGQGPHARCAVREEEGAAGFIPWRAAGCWMDEGPLLVPNPTPSTPPHAAGCVAG